MTNLKIISPRVKKSQDYEVIFNQLPPLGSEEYLRLMEEEISAKIPPQVLARAYRQLCEAKNEAGMKATLARLVQKKHLGKLVGTIRNKIPPEQGWFLAEDLIQETWIQILKVLPTERGRGAETAWASFCFQRMIDAWRKVFGREGEELRQKISGEEVTITKAMAVALDSGAGVEESYSNETVMVNPADIIGEDEALSSAFNWHVGLKESQILLLEKIIEKTVDKIQEPLLKLIATDQFGDDPSPISSGISIIHGKPPLTEQTGLSRHQISRKITIIKSILAGKILANLEVKFDVSRLREFINSNKKTRKVNKEIEPIKRGD